MRSPKEKDELIDTQGRLIELLTDHVHKDHDEIDRLNGCVKPLLDALKLSQIWHRADPWRSSESAFERNKWEEVYFVFEKAIKAAEEVEVTK